MKLELKHIAPYLPYGLKMQAKHSKLEYSVMTLCDKTGLSNIGISDVMDDIECFKPILRPLSDLSRYNDEVVINEHYINSVLTEKEYGQEYGVFCYYKGSLDIEIEGDSELRYDTSKTISFKCIQKMTELLYEGHYDVFGLIDKDLAIDINTL